MNESDDPFRNEQPSEESSGVHSEEGESSQMPMSKEVAEEIIIQADVSGAGKPLSRYRAAREGFVPPKGPSLKDRLEADRALRGPEKTEEETE